jgi:hypothetical protein
MARGPEQTFKLWVDHQLKDWSRRTGGWYVKLVGGPYQRIGLPDFLLVRGRVVALELKAPGSGLAPAQRVELGRMEKAGAIVVVATTKTEIVELLSSNGWSRWTM